LKRRRLFLFIFLSYFALKGSSQEDTLIHVSIQLGGSPLFSGSNGIFRTGGFLVLGDKYIRVRGGIFYDIQPEYIVTMSTGMAPPGPSYYTSAYSSFIIPVMIDYSFIVRKKWYSYVTLEAIHWVIHRNLTYNSNITHYDYYDYGKILSRLGLGINWQCTSKIGLFAEPYFCFSASSYYYGVFPSFYPAPTFLYGILFGVSIDLFKYSPW
jgi:hypothetical protein